MKDINDIVPKIPGMRWGALLNTVPTAGKLKELNRVLPHDGKWNLILEDDNQIHINGKTIRRRTRESMT